MSHVQFVQLLFVLLGICIVAECRKYDIEKESYRLYGMNTKLALQQLRKSPEYSKILNKKVAELKDKVSFIGNDIFFLQTVALTEKVQETMAGKEPEMPRRKFSGLDVLGFRPGKLRNKNIARNLTSVQFLESYKKLRRFLTIQQRHKLRDIGFEYAGKVFHSLIQAIQPDGALPVSTQQPYGGEATEATTEEYTPHTHVVTSDTETEATAPSPEHPEEHEHQRTRRPETFRNFRASETKRPVLRNTTLF